MFSIPKTKKAKKERFKEDLKKGEKGRMKRGKALKRRGIKKEKIIDPH